jgi:hypothetical protein
MTTKKLTTWRALALAALLTGASFTANPALAGEAEVATAAGCLAAGDPTAIAACTAGGFVINEAQKCILSGGKDCIGPNNDGRKIVEKTVVGPVTDVIKGDIGRSDKSVWRQVGLPHIRLW